MEDYRRYIYFYTKDHTGTYTTSGYSLPITPFTFIPVFDDGATVDYSKNNIYWDFGDGTTSQQITATHYYKFPGWYNVKCYVLGKEGESYLDTFSQSILVKDFISDNIAISASNNKTESGTLQNPFILSRFNSWQTYSVLSSQGYSINLSVTGNIAPILNVDEYYNDKWGHLKPSARFETEIYNTSTEKYERIPVDKLQTNNTEIYVRINNKNELVLCGKDDSGSCFAGTSGSKLFYYIDDIPKKIENVADKTFCTIFAIFDKTNFKDKDNFNKNFLKNKYSVLNDIYDSTTFSVIIEQLNSDHVTITTNGIDDDNNGNRIDTFNIYPEKFTNQKIPFVVRIKQEDGFPSKYNPILRLDNAGLSSGTISCRLRTNTNQILNDADFYENFGVLSAEQYGGYFKGYLIYDKPVDNVKISVTCSFNNQEVYLVDTTYAIIPEPESQYVHDIRVQTSQTDEKELKENNLIYVEGLSGIYSVCVTSERLKDKVQSFIWFVDSDREKIKKYDPDTKSFWEINLPENSSPSNICSDSKGNVWVTLYDSGSSIKINNLTNLEEVNTGYKRIVSTLSGVEIDDDYTITPASIDTDIDDNIWVSYSNPLSAFVEKYDKNGNYLFRKIFSPNYQCTEIITDLNYNLWGIVKDTNTATKVLSAKNDKVFKIDKNGNTVNYYDINGSLWNIAIDVKGNVWVTKNINQVVKIDVKDFDTVYNFTLPTNSIVNSLNYISDLEGITCTTDNTILIINNINKNIYYFNADSNNSNFNPKSLKFSENIFPANYIQQKANGYGDWNGFRHINKYQHILNRSKTLIGDSNVFSIYPSQSGRYNIEKINENFDAKEQIKSYRFQEYLIDKDILFNDFIGTAIGTSDNSFNNLSKTIYERIANFTDNVVNVDTCNIKSLKSIYEMVDEDLYVFNNYNYTLPAEIGNLVDLFSINFSKLKGSRNKYDLDFDDKGYNNEDIIKNGLPTIFGINKGKELNFLTSVLTAGKDIILYEKFSENYRLVSTNILSSSYIKYINPVNKTYHLSSYDPKWGWGLVLPNTYINEHIPRYYKFYEYIPTYNDKQTEGIINWYSLYTTITENITSVSEWNKIKENMIVYALAKGLEIIK